MELIKAYSKHQSCSHKTFSTLLLVLKTSKLNYIMKLVNLDRIMLKHIKLERDNVPIASITRQTVCILLCSVYLYQIQTSQFSVHIFFCFALRKLQQMQIKRLLTPVSMIHDGALFAPAHISIQKMCLFISASIKSAK